MDELEVLIDWLKQCDILEEVAFGVDHLEKTAPAAAVYPQGITVLWRKENVLGQWHARYSLRCMVSVRLTKSGDGRDAAGAWLKLQQWVQQHPAPSFGEAQISRLEKGKLVKENGDGTAIYEAVLTVEYTKAG